MDSEKQQTDFLYEFLAWFEVNKKRVLVGGTAALVLCGGIATVSWYKQQNEIKASEALSNIEAPYMSAADANSAETIEKLQKMIADYSGTDASVRAELIRASVLFTSGKYSEAGTAFDSFMRKHSTAPFVDAAAFGVAACLDAQGKTKEAIDKYAEFARSYPTSPILDQAQLNLGMLYELTGENKKAVDEYDKIVKKQMYSPATSTAQQKQMALISKYPNLAPVAVPPTPTMAPVNVPKATNVPVPVSPATNVAAPAKPAAAASK